IMLLAARLAAALALTLGVQTAGTPLQRFLARGEEPTVEYRALRHLEAENSKFNQRGWMVAWTEFDHVNGFHYQIVRQGRSAYVRSQGLAAALEGEQKIWANPEPQKASLTTENYVFDNDLPDSGGLAAVGLKPKRKDVLLVEGAIFVQPGDGDLERI